jgi:arabinofuranosyltransferase
LNIKELFQNDINIPKNLVVFSVFSLALYAFISTAWVADDAYITFRSIDHFWHGYGLRWNIQERVQTYTHPLWMLFLLVVGYPIQNLYATAISLSLICFLIILTILYKNLNTYNFIYCTLTIIASISFIDFSSSGLENPLLHLISCISIIHMSTKKDITVRYISTSTSLLFITRIDAIIIFIPLLINTIINSTKKHGILKTIKPLLLGFLPAMIWTIFSIYYYGSILPNTAWAKLNHGISHTILISQAIDYFKANIIHDPTTTFVILYFIATSISSKQPIRKMIAFGVLANIAYLFWIGADYMYGRFLSNIFLCSTILIFVNNTSRLQIKYTISIAMLIFFNSQNWSKNFSFKYISPEGMADERGFYYSTNGLLPKTLHSDVNIVNDYSWMGDLGEKKPDNIIIKPNIGMYGYYTKPYVYIIDPLALSDLFLSQHPMRSGHWRIGHHERYIPYLYISSIRSGKNMLVEKNDRDVLQDTWLITRAPLNSSGRFAAIMRLNTGQLKEKSIKATMLYTTMNTIPISFPQNTKRFWIGVDSHYLQSPPRRERR